MTEPPIRPLLALQGEKGEPGPPGPEVLGGLVPVSLFLVGSWKSCMPCPLGSHLSGMSLAQDRPHEPWLGFNWWWFLCCVLFQTKPRASLKMPRTLSVACATSELLEVCGRSCHVGWVGVCHPLPTTNMCPVSQGGRGDFGVKGAPGRKGDKGEPVSVTILCPGQWAST